MRLPLQLTIASIVLDPVTGLSYLESLGHENISRPSSNESSRLLGSSKPYNTQHEVSYQAGSNQSPGMSARHPGLSTHINRISAECPSSGDKSIALPDHGCPDNQSASGRLQDESISPSQIADRRNTTSYTDSISLSTRPKLPDAADPSLLDGFSSKPGFGSLSENKSPMECVGVDGETSPNCDGFDSVQSRFAVSRQRWAGTSCYLDSLSSLPQEKPINMLSTTLRIETRSGEGPIGPGSEEHTSTSRSTLTFTIPAENVAE